MAYFCRFWTNCSKKCHIIKYGNHPFGDKFLASGNTAPRQNNWPEIGGHDVSKVTTKKLRNLGLIQVHLKLQKSLESKKVTKKGEYYFAKGFKHVVSCAKKNCSDLLMNGDLKSSVVVDHSISTPSKMM